VCALRDRETTVGMDMKIIESGHIYQLHHLDGSGAGILVFVNREPGTEHEGVQTQEILRALIDRTQHCDSCRRWDGNDRIIQHLRMALALHESRAIERKTEKGIIEPEKLPTGDDGHFTLSETPAADAMLATLDKASEQSMQLLTDVGILRGRLRDLYASAAELNAHGQHNQAAVVQRNIVATHQRLNQLETPPKTDAQITPYVCTTPMCGESGVCDECRSRGAR
jgi:hypothetical protein